MAIIINNGQSTTENTNIQNDIKIPNSSFYYGDDFEKQINQIMDYALDIAFENYISDVLNFPLNRIIYSSNEFCFREREKKCNGQLDIPFMNYYKTGFTETDRRWFKNQSNLRYILDSENIEKYLGNNFRVTPVKCEYESTIFFSQHKDCEYAYKKLLFESSNEAIIPYSIIIKDKDTEIKNTAILYLDLDFNPTYNESDWLEENKIYTIDMNFSLDTFIIMGRNDNISIAKEVLGQFICAKNGSDLTNLKDEDIISKLDIYFGETI